MKMKRVILIKYGELSTKKGNRNFFINTLTKNIKDKLKDIDTTIYKDRGRMYIEFVDSDLDKILGVINKIFGIHSYQVAYVVDSDIDKIKELVLEVMKKEVFKTFKVISRRADKSFPYHSEELNNMLGGLILKNIDCKVDVHNPDVKVNLEVRDKYSFIYLNSYSGSGGYPVGTQSKGLLMLSGGIDSPVAGYLAMKRGIKIEAVYFEAIPHTSLEAREKVITLTKKLVNYTSNIKLHVINFTEIQEAIYKNCDGDYTITIMRRMMYRIMDKLAHKDKAYCIINGESVGQVASQTLTSMRVINSVTNMPIIRPVACLDKLEIIDIAKKIDTYETSILPYEDCCTVFVPKHPVINPKISKAEDEEKKINYDEMINSCIANELILNITDKEEYSNLL
jgi:thiamine biosynthesis protein ThiI